MHVVLLQLLTTGPSVAADELAYIGAHRLCLETGTVSDRLHTYVRPQREPLAALRELMDRPDLEEEALIGLPDVASALRQLSAFVGDAVLSAHRGSTDAGPVLRETCARHGLPTRRLRLLDGADLARRLFGAETMVTLRELNRRLCLPSWQPRARLEVALERQGQILHRLWRLLDPAEGEWPVGLGHTVLPQREELP
jgi:DNA polymerase III alpha subunit (gram-positive type)